MLHALLVWRVNFYLLHEQVTVMLWLKYFGKRAPRRLLYSDCGHRRIADFSDAD